MSLAHAYRVKRKSDFKRGKSSETCRTVAQTASSKAGAQRTAKGYGQFATWAKRHSLRLNADQSRSGRATGMHYVRWLYGIAGDRPQCQRKPINPAPFQHIDGAPAMSDANYGFSPNSAELFGVQRRQPLGDSPCLRHLQPCGACCGAGRACRRIEERHLSGLQCTLA